MRSPTDAIRELAISELMRKRTAYSLDAAQFEKKYGVSFAEFELKVKACDPAPDTEQDYLDWDMAVSVLEDIEEELLSLK